MRIHQLVHTLNPGDAISGEALAIQRLLREACGESEIYVLHAHDEVRHNTRDWRRFSDDVKKQLAAGEPVSIILHYSIGCPLNRLFAELQGVRRIVIYHNLTPAQWFDRCNATVARDLRRGRQELCGLLENVDLVLADSEYNRRELAEFGCHKAFVLPLMLDESKWSLDANSGIVQVLRTHGGTNILHVGRMAPNKCIEDVIKAFYFYHHKIQPKSRLWLVGTDVDTEIYSFTLRRMALGLHLSEAVSFCGAVADCELRAFYENSDIYLCMSEHEGFCLPLLEAMYFGLPVIAYNATAVGETLGNGGLLLARKSAAETAELMNILMTDPALKAKFVQRGKQRLAAFSEAAFTELFRKLVITSSH